MTYAADDDDSDENGRAPAGWLTDTRSPHREKVAESTSEPGVPASLPEVCASQDRGRWLCVAKAILELPINDEFVLFTMS